MGNKREDFKGLGFRVKVMVSVEGPTKRPRYKSRTSTSVYLSKTEVVINGFAN